VQAGKESIAVGQELHVADPAAQPVKKPALAAAHPAEGVTSPAGGQGKSSNLFKAAPAPRPAPESDDAYFDAPKPKAEVPMAATIPDAPTFREVPLPPDPTEAPAPGNSPDDVGQVAAPPPAHPAHPPAAHHAPAVHAAPTGHHPQPAHHAPVPAAPHGDARSALAGKNHEVLVRVKAMLVKQEQVIQQQEQQLASLRGQVEQLQRSLYDLRNKAEVDDQSIAELAEFLHQHEGQPAPRRTAAA
jgi:hypothetical protein